MSGQKNFPFTYYYNLKGAKWPKIKTANKKAANLFSDLLLSLTIGGRLIFNLTRTVCLYVWNLSCAWFLLHPPQIYIEQSNKQQMQRIKYIENPFAERSFVLAFLVVQKDENCWQESGNSIFPILKH